MVSSIDSGRTSSIALARTVSSYELRHPRQAGTSVLQLALRSEAHAIKQTLSSL
jgi:hypothetical protein